MYCLDHEGTEEWTFPAESHIRGAPCIADLNMDGILEILVGSYDNNLYCLSLTDSPHGSLSPWRTFSGSMFHTGWMDSDGDYLDDLTESFYGTDSSNPDTDGDGFIDGWEVQVGLNPLKDDASKDKDGDGLTNFEEAMIYHTSLFNPDTDGDCLCDWEEINVFGTDPNNPDSDNNGQTDGEEHGCKCYTPTKRFLGRLFGLYLLPVWVTIMTVSFWVYLRKRSKPR